MTAASLRCFISSALAATAIASAASAQVPYAARVTSIHSVALNTTNYGFLGNNFGNRSSSFEYPAASGYEHMPWAGLWIGARASGTPRVTTATVEIVQGSSAPSATEFTPASAIARRSTLQASPFYHPGARSHEDFISEFDDLTPKNTQANPETHAPLGLRVRQDVYCWADPLLTDIVFLRYVIRSTTTLEDVWVGIHSLLASGDKNEYSTWPPNSLGSPFGSWYRKAWLEYDAPQRLLREHYCRAQPVPSGCVPEHVPIWAGIQILTPPGAGQSVTLGAWQYAPTNASRDADAERYALMSAGTLQDLTVPDVSPGTGDPVELLALGPFAELVPGDSLVIDFAVLGGYDVESIRDHATIAQSWRDQGFEGEITPVLASGAAEVDAGRVRLRWHLDSPVSAATVYRREENTAWAPLGACSRSGETLVYEDLAAEPGRRYGYRIGIRESDRETFAGEVWVDMPAAPGFRMHGLRPHPARSQQAGVAFSLDRGGPVTLEVLDLGGRRVAFRDFGTIEAGDHVLPLGVGPALAPGAYFFRLAQGSRVAVKRGVIVR